MGRQYGTNTVSSEEAHAYAESQRKQAEAMRIKTERIIGAVILVLGVILLGTGIFEKVTGPGRLQELDVQIAAANETLKEKLEFNESGGNIVHVDPVTNNAKEAGSEICELQNKLMAFDDEYQMRRRSAPPGEQVDFSDEHKETLARFKSWVIDSKNSGIWSYYGKWEFHNVFDYAGDELSIIWICYDVTDVNKNIPLAFVTGRYSASKDKVSELTRYITPAYETLVSQDILRNEGKNFGSEVLNPNSSVMQIDQAGDPSIGPPNSMTPEEAAEWARQQVGTDIQDGGQSQQGMNGSDGSGDVQQWTRPQTDASVSMSMGE